VGAAPRHLFEILPEGFESAESRVHSKEEVHLRAVVLVRVDLPVQELAFEDSGALGVAPIDALA
jgi:hypothetical protein